MDSLSQLVRDILNWIPNLVTALLLLFVGFIFAEFAKNAVVKAINTIINRKKGLSPQIASESIACNQLETIMNQMDAEYVSRGKIA